MCTQSKLTIHRRRATLCGVLVATGLVCASGLPAQSPQLVKDINPGAANAEVRWLTQAGNRMFFVADDGKHGLELWIKDSAGVRMVKDIAKGATGSHPTNLVAVDDDVLFAAAQPGLGVELWRSNGTETGTVLVHDILPGNLGSHPTHLFRLGERIYFSANSGKHGHELYAIHARTGSIVLVRDIWPGSPISTNSLPRYFAALPNGKFVFRANDGKHGSELMISDGSANGTTLLKDIRPGVLGSSPGDMTSFRGRVYFRANDGTSGYELWVTDGTAGGTKMLKEIGTGRNSSHPKFFAQLGDRLFFQATASGSGAELWSTDGTAPNTVLVKDIFKGASGSAPAFLTPVGSRYLYFVANDGNTGPELWRSDGTANGTKLIEDTLKGRNGLGPSNTLGSINPRFVVLSGLVYFVANDGKSGRELWAFDNGATATPVGTSCFSSQPTMSATDPIIGGRMTITARAPNGTQTVIVLGLPGRAFRIGTCAVRLNLAVPIVPLLYSSSTTASFGVNIPKTVTIIGITGRLQTAHGNSATIVFSNPVDLIVGR